VKGTSNKGLVFDEDKDATYDVVEFSDSVYCVDLGTRRSISGYIFTLCVDAIW